MFQCHQLRTTITVDLFCILTIYSNREVYIYLPCMYNMYIGMLIYTYAFSSCFTCTFSCLTVTQVELNRIRIMP